MFPYKGGEEEMQISHLLSSGACIHIPMPCSLPLDSVNFDLDFVLSPSGYVYSAYMYNSPLSN